MMRLVVCVWVGLWAVSTAAMAGGDRIWSALVLATNENPSRPVPNKLERFAPVIRKIFGYHSLYLVGEQKRPLVWGKVERLEPSKEFHFRVHTLSRESTFYRLRIELFRDKDLLLTAQANLARDAPLYIRGPQWGGGQLILVIEVR